MCGRVQLLLFTCTTIILFDEDRPVIILNGLSMCSEIEAINVSELRYKKEKHEEVHCGGNHFTHSRIRSPFNVEENVN